MAVAAATSSSALGLASGAALQDLSRSRLVPRKAVQREALISLQGFLEVVAERRAPMLQSLQAARELQGDRRLVVTCRSPLVQLVRATRAPS